VAHKPSGLVVGWIALSTFLLRRNGWLRRGFAVRIDEALRADTVLGCARGMS